MKSVHTSCKECIFATYEGKTQTGCELGRLKKYKEQGFVQEVYDEDKEFYVIRDRICLKCRDHNWRERYSKLDNEQIKQLVDWQAQVQYQVVIIMESNSVAPLTNTLSSLDEQKIIPKKVVVVNQNEVGAKPGKIISKLKTDKWAWKLQNIEFGREHHECVDLVIKMNRQYPYYVVCKDGYMFDRDFSTELNHSLLEDLKTFGVAKDRNIEIVPTIFHMIHNGNKGKLLTDKFKDNDMADKIIEVKELCPSS